MELTKILNNNVSAYLKKIEYNVYDEEKFQVNIADNFLVNEITHDNISLVVSRDITLEMNEGFRLHIEVDFKRYAQRGIDLTTTLSKEVIEKNITDICAPVMNFISLLISQITASFNRNPIITSPNYIK